MTANETTQCPTCALLRGLVQCNKCRSANPNAQTLTRRAVLAESRERGVSIATVEAERGLTPCDM